ncbi:MAG: 4-hydroxy-tetrahydrodipicolinate synthase [Balneolaceae bacterium]
MKNTQLWTALVTPMQPDGQIDFEDLESLVRRQEKAGNGVLLIGSTGEGLALGEEEKMAVVEHVSDMQLSVPVMAGVGGYNLEIQKKWIRYCNGLEIDAFLLVTPLYSKPGPVGQVEWFTALLSVSEKPCMVYNIPGRTGAKIPPSVFDKIESHTNFWSIKEASGSIRDYQAFRLAIPNVPIYSGDDGMLPFFAVAGCSGLVSVASNVWPEATKLYVERCLKGETESLFPLWKHATEILFCVSNPIPAKMLLLEKGLIKSPVLRMPLTPSELDSTEDLIHMDQEISNWFNENNTK